MKTDCKQNCKYDYSVKRNKCSSVIVSLVLCCFWKKTAFCFAMTLLKSHSREETEHVRAPLMGSFYPRLPNESLFSSNCVDRHRQGSSTYGKRFKTNNNKKKTD